MTLGKKRAGRKQTESTQKRKGPANQKQVEVKKVTIPCDDMIAKPTLPEPAPNQYILSMLKICHINVSKCHGCGGAFYEKGYPQEPNDLVVVPKLRWQFIDAKTKVPKFTFISVEPVSRDITAVLCRNLLNLQKT